MNSNGVFDARNDAFFAKALARSVRYAAAGGGMRGALRRSVLLWQTFRFHKWQAARRTAAALEGRSVPGILIASVTRRCNLDCAGCYSKALRPAARAAGKPAEPASQPAAELSDERFLELFREAISLGTGTIMIAGGEPLLRRNLIEGAARLKGPLIPVFTNGTLVDEAYLDLFASSHLVPVFSVEGDAAFTAERRGDGVHEAALAAAAALKRRGALFGLSVTLTSANADAVLSERFLREVESMGASVLFLVEYVPVTGKAELVLSDAQKAELGRPGRFDPYAFMTVSLPGDEEAFGGCLAAGRGFIHVADDGALEACPFAPFSDTDVASRPLAEALESPLMREIRSRHAELTETKGGCALWNKRGWVASLGACSAGARGSAGAGDSAGAGTAAIVASALPA